MIYTAKIKEAIRFSIKTHEIYQKQKRKGKDIAYITHPLTVGLILSQAGAREEVVIAGILHDTIEDSIEEKKVSKEMIRERFGEEVASLVMSVSETDKSLSWEERKAEALEHISHFSNEQLLLKSADIIANSSELLDDIEKHGEETFNRFNAPKERIIEHYMIAVSLIFEKWQESPLVEDLTGIFEKLHKLTKDSSKQRKYRVTFQALVGESITTEYLIEANSEEEAQTKGLEKLIEEESDGILAQCPAQIAIAEEVSE